MVIVYLIRTEHVAPSLVSHYFTGYSIKRNIQGFWEGKPEASVQIEIIGTLADAAKVRELMEVIRVRYNQAEVWLTTYETTLTRATVNGFKQGLGE